MKLSFGLRSENFKSIHNVLNTHKTYYCQNGSGTVIPKIHKALKKSCIVLRPEMTGFLDLRQQSG